MKKLIFIILICILTLFCLSGCQEEKDERLIDSESELVQALIKYVQESTWDKEAIDVTPGIVADMIYEGMQALLIQFDPDSYYYVAGYYPDPEKLESDRYLNAKEYAWLRFESCTDIPETYEDKNLVVAVQINRSKTVRDIMSEDSNVPEPERFWMYKTSFENGFNINPPIAIPVRTAIYLNRSDSSEIYYPNGPYVLDCVLHEGEYYLRELYAQLYYGEYYEWFDVVEEIFGRYYNAIMDAKEPEDYVVDSESGYEKYILIKVDNFAKAIKSVWEAEE